jgi:TPR repeat protein
MAAENGNAAGLVQTGDWYLSRGRRGAFENRMNKDAAEAVRWYKMAAEKRDANGQQKLGDMHCS